MVKFNTTQEESLLIAKIVERAERQLKIEDPWGLRMDLDVTHSNGTPLDFNKLLSFDDFNFAHDICGIINHLNRNNGKMSCFLPRCAR